ncbi:hypothetical protein C8Q74DRAFT_304804 [Fomes fomentarius]|nr:hypothetical protein C8Q74DRAFT_304804 [Fomes fomentarius]
MAGRGDIIRSLHPLFLMQTPSFRPTLARTPPISTLAAFSTPKHMNRGLPSSQSPRMSMRC